MKHIYIPVSLQSFYAKNKSLLKILLDKEKAHNELCLDGLPFFATEELLSAIDKCKDDAQLIKLKLINNKK